MRKIIVTEFMTLDGVIEAPGGEPTHPHAAWSFDFGSPGYYEYKVAELFGVEALLLGKKTYEGFAAAWPGRTDEAGYADRINKMPKYVVSTTLQQADWSPTHILRDVAKDVGALKQTGEGDILVFGSGSLVKGLLQHQLVDELRLMIHPVTIGGGLGIFPQGREKQRWSLKQSKEIDNGVLILEYAIS